MSDEIDALLIFCEGPHDSAFLKMTLTKLMGYEVRDLKFTEMPSPFNSMFSSAVKNHAAQDMSLDMAHKFFLPDFVLCKGSTFVFIFNCGGDTRNQKVKILLASFIPLLLQAGIFTAGATSFAKSAKYLFLSDSDANGIEKITEELNKELKKIDDQDFISGDWKESSSEFGRVAVDKAIFVWGATPTSGTLEDIIFPMFDHAEPSKGFTTKASASMADMFVWDVDHESTVKSVAEKAKYKKAVLTTAGQRERPGSSLNVILSQSGLITQNALESCKTTAGLVKFINEFMQS